MSDYNLQDNLDNNPSTSDGLQKIILKSAKFKEIQIYPATVEMNTSGFTPFHSISIKESVFSPIVSGSLVVFDIKNFVENLNIEGFESIELEFKKTTKSKITKFKGIITDVTLLTDDSVLANKMNMEEYIRLFSLTFMNKDLMYAQYKIPQNSPHTEISINKDFVGWIAKQS